MKEKLHQEQKPYSQTNLVGDESWETAKNRLFSCLNSVIKSLADQSDHEDYEKEIDIKNIPEKVQVIIRMINEEINSTKITVENIKIINTQISNLKKYIIDSTELANVIIYQINPLQRNLEDLIYEFDVAIPREQDRRRSKIKKPKAKK